VGRGSIEPLGVVVRQGNGSADPGHPGHPRPADAPLGVLAGTSPDGRSLGLYVHVPFCTKRCHYCSFNTAPLDGAGPMRRYLGAVRREVGLLAGAAWAGEVEIGTIFFGGGTPSLLDADDLAGLLDAVRAAFAVAPGAEVTVECNPESVSRQKLAAYRAAGVNRISLGVQSLDDAILARLGRLHDARTARVAFEAAREAGCDNVSVDLMHGLPDLDPPTWSRTVEGVLGWGPEHLSAYGLTLDAGSLWAVTGVDGLPAEAAVVEQYWTLARAAAAHGLEHYEISNYGRPGFRARHNLVYWHAAEYLAVGPGACGFLGEVRYGNVKPVVRYCAALESGALPIDTWERLTPRQRLGERLILGLRLAAGVPGDWLDARLATDAALAGTVQIWRERQLLREQDGRVSLSEAGFLLSDALFVDLL
jgi:oxygen-independent coproporphyrinogen-3 oxidase